ncbi:MAG: single-stranded DNA-binding protein [Candidatus Odinarchaeota archaeon]|nr:single-stranded DNA-binding protein [Candidatus Odinarchaeota archaeon]
MSEEFKVVSDLRPKLREVNLKFKVVEKSEPREVTSQKDGSTHKVAEAVIGDETGNIKMTLWDDQIDMLEEGKTYELQNGYVGFFRNTLRLNIGKYGSIKEIEEDISEVNMENDLSERVYRPRRSFNRGYGTSQRGYRRGGTGGRRY